MKGSLTCQPPSATFPGSTIRTPEKTGGTSPDPAHETWGEGVSKSCYTWAHPFYGKGAR